MDELSFSFFNLFNTMEIEQKVFRTKSKATLRESKKFQWESQEFEH
jgi:hypothetical protein